MKRALSLTLVMILLAAGITAVFTQKVNASGDDVTFTENTIYGDITAADGITLSFERDMLSHLQWKSTVTFEGKEMTSGTSCDFHRDSIVHLSVHEPQGLILHESYAYMDSLLFGLVEKEKEELEEIASPGETVTKVLKLSDYFEYYPIAVNIETPELSILGDHGSAYEQYAAERIAEFLRIPVLENEYFLIQVTGGGNYSWGISSYEGEYSDSWSPYAQSVVTSDAVYFVLETETYRGNRVDTSLIPGGYGICILPCGTTVTEDHHGFGRYEGPDVFIDEMKVFFPLGEDTHIVSLDTTDDGNHIVLHTIEDGIYRIRVIDPVTAEIERSMELNGSYAPGENYFEMEKGDGITLIIADDGTLHLLCEDEEGMPFIVMETVPCEIEKTDRYRNMIFFCRSAAYDGERLVVAGSGSYGDEFYYYRDSDCGFWISVYGKDGLRFSGTYTSSLDEANFFEPNYHDMITSIYGISPVISFE